MFIEVEKPIEFDTTPHKIPQLSSPYWPSRHRQQSHGALGSNKAMLFYSIVERESAAERKYGQRFPYSLNSTLVPVESPVLVVT